MNRTFVLFVNVLVVATCGLVYELLAGTLASYVLGDSVTQFSLVIGIYLSALGVGAWISGGIEHGIARKFVETELTVALVGGVSAPMLFIAFGRINFFQPLLYGTVFVIGVLVGLELPLLMRIIKDRLEFKELVARVLAFDYIGALLASLLFPLFLVPELGLIRTSLVFGMLNAAVGLWATWILRPMLPEGVFGLRACGVGVLAILTIGLVRADSLTTLAEEELYADEIVHSQTSRFQRIIVTRGRAGFNLYLNGHLQFASSDEYRYHESLVHPVLAQVSSPKRVLILGGGDGLALREVLRWPSVTAVTLVDLDPAMTNLSTDYPPLGELNRQAFLDPRVTVVNRDAYLWVSEESDPFDAAIIDFPDPSSYSVGKLYTTRFYRMLQRRLTPEAAVSVQCTSPLFAPHTYWCIVRTLEAAGFSVRPYHAALPSFGVWGFALARKSPFHEPRKLPEGLRFLSDATVANLFVWPVDLGPVPVEINRLDNQVVVRYHESEWRRYEGGY
jgi:spermidine synthase